MSDTTMIKPPRIGVAAEASAQARIIGPARTDGRSVLPPKAPTSNLRRHAGGQFGTTGGVQINRRGEAPVTKLATQTLTILRGTLASLVRFCDSEGAKAATKTATDALALVDAIAAGQSIADAPAPPKAP